MRLFASTYDFEQAPLLEYGSPSIRGTRRARFIAATADLSARPPSGGPVGPDLSARPPSGGPVGPDLSRPQPIYRPGLVHHPKGWRAEIYGRASPLGGIRHREDPGSRRLFRTHAPVRDRAGGSRGRASGSVHPTRYGRALLSFNSVRTLHRRICWKSAAV